MRIAVTYESGEIFQHFGHTQQMKLYDVENDQVVSSQVCDTNGSGHGALAGFLKDFGVDVLLCGGIGGGAQAALAEAGIKLYGGCRGNADQAVENFLNNALMYDPNVRCSHHGEGHDCNHDCGSHSHCGGGEEHEIQTITLTITDEAGTAQDVEFRVIALYSVEEQQYIALTPDLHLPELEANIFLFRYLEENGQGTVEEIVEDEEFARAADAFQKWQLSRG